MPQPYVVLPPRGSDPADEWIRLGVQAHVEGKLDQADTNYRQALRLDPRNVVATQNLALALASRGNFNEALLTIERAALWDGKTSLLHSNRALICLESERIEEALAAVEVALKIAETTPKIEFPDSTVQAHFVRALISGTAGKSAIAAESYEEILDREPKHPAAGPNSCFVQTLLDTPPEKLLWARKRYAAAHRPPGSMRRLWGNNRDPNKVLKVGYVGGDFKTHSAAMIFSSVVLRHDPKQVEQYIYSSLPVNAEADEITRQFWIATENGKRWRDIVPLNDDQAAGTIEKDGIDILVDLAAHTSGGRLGIFFRKPAPIQCTGWGFAHGTGLEEVDYFLADPVAVPESERRFYTEKIADLPCIVGYTPPAHPLKGSSTAPYASRDYFTFGSYARYEKLSDECLQAFAEILRQVPGSKLQFKDHAFRRPYSIKRVMSFMKGIEPERLLFSISTSHADHLLAYQQCDLCLDPWPHGGGVVFLEQMWMGVPTLTLRGKQPSGRTGASVLTALGHPEWIAESVEDFIEKAVRNATDEVAMRKLFSARKTLREEFQQSPVMNGYAQSVEVVYRRLWQEWCR